MLDNMMKISLTLVAFDKMSKVIRDAVNKSNSEFDKLQKKIKTTSETLDELGKNMAKVGAGMTLGGGAIAYKLGITQAIPETLALEHQLRELGNIGQLSAKQLESMDKRLGSISKYTNQFRSELAEGLNVLVASGVNPEKALDYMNVIGKTATAEQAAIIDISKTAFSVSDNLKVPIDDLAKSMDILAMSGKEGRFELKDMAAAFPSLTAGASMLGMRGTPAVASLGAALQVAMKGAGEASEAANNLENFIQKVTSPLAVKNFEEVFGINLKQVLIDAAEQGKDPILEVVEIMKQASGGDMFRISEVFQDKQVLNFLKPMLQNLDEYKRIKASALGADGVIDSDFSNMMTTTNEQIKLLKINMKELVFPHLEGPLKALNNMLTTINKHPILQKGIFGAIIGTITLGVVLTTLGTACVLVGKLISGYGTFLKYTRDLTPVLTKLSAKMVEFFSINSSSGLIANLKKLNTNLKTDFAALPTNIAKSTASLKEWIVTSVKAIPTNFMNGLNAFKKGFLSIPSMIRTAIVAFRAFTVTLLTNPLGWIALAISAVAFVIFKYWKPISGFFKGLWQGLKEGFLPLMPLFQRIGQAVSPLLKPIQVVINWIKKILKPVEDTGGAAEKMGVRFGKAIAGIIVKIVELITKVFEFGRKIGDMLANGILSKIGKTKDAIGKHAQIIRDHLPHSPAKTGPLKDLHKVKIVETIASTIKPLPLISAMNKSLSFVSSRANLSATKAGNKGSSFVINYSPTITMPNGTVKEDFSKLLKQHKDEVIAILKREFERKERLAY